MNALLESKTIWTVDDFVMYTGYSIDSVYKFTSSNRIPYYKLSGRRIFFIREEVMLWLQSRKIKSVTEIRNETYGL